METKKDKNKPQVTPVKGNAGKPACYGKKLVVHDCIRCSWQERCLYDSFIEEINEFKTAHHEEYLRIRETITNTTSFEE